jgi:hypothetical protein
MAGRSGARAQAPERDAVNDLYDHGCDLVEAARALRRDVHGPGAARAAPAVLGCVETALYDLRDTAAALNLASAAAGHGEHGPAPATGRQARMRKGFANLEVALHDAADAAAAARSLAARGLSAARGRRARRGDG